MLKVLIGHVMHSCWSAGESNACCDWRWSDPTIKTVPLPEASSHKTSPSSLLAICGTSLPFRGLSSHVTRFDAINSSSFHPSSIVHTSSTSKPPMKHRSGWYRGHPLAHQCGNRAWTSLGPPWANAYGRIRWSFCAWPSRPSWLF